MKLWLIRHAQADSTSAGAADFCRPLNARGHRDGERMVLWLADQTEPATWIWTSDAVRASSTARVVAGGFAGARVVEDHRLYDAGPEQLLEVIRETPPDVASVALVGHNPGMTVLVNLLSGGEATGGLPTLGIARLEVPGPWSELRFGRARLELLTGPRDLLEEKP